MHTRNIRRLVNIEKWGTGIPRLFEACEEYGLPKPELIDFDGDFRVNMYRKRGTNAETNRETGTNIETNTQLTQKCWIQTQKALRGYLVS